MMCLKRIDSKNNFGKLFVLVLKMRFCISRVLNARMAVIVDWLRPCSDLVLLPGHGARALK